MIQAFVRLFTIAILASIGCFLVLFVLRQFGLSQEHGALKHPILDRPTLLIADGGNPEAGPESSLAAFQDAAENGWILGVGLQLTSDENWIVYNYETLEQQTTGQGLVSFQTLEQIRSIQLTGPNVKPAAILTFEELIDAFPETPLLLNILVRHPEKMLSLQKILQAKMLESRVILQSPFATALRELHKTLPRWVFGLDPSSVTRFLFMKSLYIETFADLKSDVFIADAKMQDQFIFDDRLIAELRRRHKKIIPRVTPPLDEQTQKLLTKTDGFMTKRPSGFTP